MKKFWILMFGFWISSGCGIGEIKEQIQTTPEGGSLSLSPQDNVFVAAASFTDPVGSIATVGLNNPHPVQKSKAITDSSDVIIKSFDDKLYVINRGITSTIQVIDPSSFEILGNYSIGVGSNPQDLMIANEKAYITRLDSHLFVNQDDIWIVEPISGKFLKGLNLRPFTADDGDRLSRAAKMERVGDLLYVLVQDLSRNFEATTNGKVVIVDTKTDTFVDVDSLADGIQAIELKGRNPTDIVYQASLGRLFISNTGFFDSQFNNDPATAYGGIEILDATTNKTLGISIDDADFGGYVSMIKFVSENLGVITVKSSTIATFDPKNLKAINKNLYTSPGAFVPDLLIDKNGLLWIPERDPKNAGVLLIDPSSGASIAGPFQVGALPASMTLIK